MRICRIRVADDISYAAIDNLGPDLEVTDDSVIALIEGHPFGEWRPQGQVYRARDVELLAPVLPSKVVGIGRNYQAHVAEMNNVAPEEPLLFLKPNTSVIGPGTNIEIPWQSEHVDHEAELAVVIGRMCRSVPKERVAEVIFGYTCANDVSARDLQKKDQQWARAKGFDSFCPLGPWIETEIEADALAVTCTVNGEVRQAGNTSDLIFDIPTLVAHVSEAMTLLPGDVILTGTPSGVGPLHAGDSVSVTIEGIGTLTNGVVDRG